MADTTLIDWRVLAGSIVTFLTFLNGWAYKLYFTYLRDNRDKINQMIDSEIDINVRDYEKLKSDIGRDKFADRLLDLTTIKNEVIDGKEAFEKKMILASVTILLA